MSNPDRTWLVRLRSRFIHEIIISYNMPRVRELHQYIQTIEQEIIRRGKPVGSNSKETDMYKLYEAKLAGAGIHV